MLIVHWQTPLKVKEPFLCRSGSLENQLIILTGVVLHGASINRWFNFFFTHCLDNQLCQIPSLHGLRHLLILDAVRHHGEAEWTTYGYRIGFNGDRLFGSRIVDPLPDIFFHPHSRSAGAAAEALV